MSADILQFLCPYEKHLCKLLIPGIRQLLVNGCDVCLRAQGQCGMEESMLPGRRLSTGSRMGFESLVVGHVLMADETRSSR